MKKYIALVLMFVLVGCAGFGASTRGDEERIKALEEKVLQLEDQVLMGGAAGVGANFYPARSLDGGAAGDLDKITGTSDAGSGDADAGFVTTTEDEATAAFDHSIFFFKIDDNDALCPSGSDDLPWCLDPADVDDDAWTLLHVWGRGLSSGDGANGDGWVDIYEDTDLGGNKIRTSIPAAALGSDFVATIPAVTATYVMARGGTAGNDYINENEFVPVGWMDDTGATDPAAISAVSTTTNSREYKCRQFDGTADENLTFSWVIPEDLNATNGVKYQVMMIDTSGGGATKDLEFEVEGMSLGDNDSGDFASFSGTVQTSAIVDQTWSDDDIIFTTLSSAMTSTHIPNLATGELVEFWFNRNADGNDDYASDVCVIGVIFRYTRALSNNF